MNILFDINAKKDKKIEKLVENFFKNAPTLEKHSKIPIVIFQDGVNDSYYVKCSISAKTASDLVDINAKLVIDKQESFRANRELLLTHKTYIKMKLDAEKGREFNDIIVEYNLEYNPEKPLKVWGGQHRIKAILDANHTKDRYHGFKIYFDLNINQRSEVALISNTNISVSNDTFDRMIEETMYGDVLRSWCQKVGFLNPGEDFPDVGSTSERITVKQARSFVVNFYLGRKRGQELSADKLDKNIYEPYMTETGVTIDPQYNDTITSNDILKDEKLIGAGKKFLELHRAQQKAVKENSKKVSNRKSFRNKALVESILCGWSYVAGLLQDHGDRLKNHYRIPKTNSKVPDPLNAREMSVFKHDSDPATYRGLGTRSSLKDRQRMAQLFLAKSLEPNCLLDKSLLNKAVSQVIGIQAFNKGYTNA